MPVFGSSVGWYWTISISLSGTPALNARAIPSPVFIHEDRRSEPFVVPVNILELQARLEECVKKVESDLVCSEQCSFYAHSTEGTHANPAVRVTTKGTAPVLKPH